MCDHDYIWNGVYSVDRSRIQSIRSFVGVSLSFLPATLATPNYYLTQEQSILHSVALSYESD